MATTTTTTTTDSIDRNTRAPNSRFNWWLLLTAFSIVVLCAVLDSSNNNVSDRGRTQKWIVSVASISLSLAALASIAHIAVRARFVGTSIEGGLAIICLAFWAAALPSIMNPNAHIAIATFAQNPGVASFTNTFYANVYYFSWASFLVSLILAGWCAQELLHTQSPTRYYRRSMFWVGLAIASFIVMASASRTYHLANCQRGHGSFYDDSCGRVKLAVSLGALGTAIALLLAFISPLKWLVLECVAGVVVIIWWCFAVSYIVFGNKAPAPGTSNLYFSTWFAFAFAIYAAADAIAEFAATQFVVNEPTTTTAPPAKVPAKVTTPPSNTEADAEAEETYEVAPNDPATMEPSNV